MLISRVIEQARSGELSNLTSKGLDDAKVITYINLGLVELYKRFPLRTSEAIITMHANKDVYKLSSNDPDVDMLAGIDMLSLYAVYDEGGAQLSINVEEDDYSVLTPTWNTIQVPYPAEGEVLSVIFLAGPDYVTDVTQQLELPISLLEALLHYIGYRAHGSLDGKVEAESNTHYQRFEASCKRADMLGVVTTEDMGVRDVKMKGFL